jgi:hypothetical protein
MNTSKFKLSPARPSAEPASASSIAEFAGAAAMVASQADAKPARMFRLNLDIDADHHRRPTSSANSLRATWVAEPIPEHEQGVPRAVRLFSACKSSFKDLMTCVDDVLSISCFEQMLTCANPDLCKS